MKIMRAEQYLHVAMEKAGEVRGGGLDKVHGTWLNKVLETEREVKSFCQQRRVEPWGIRGICP